MKGYQCCWLNVLNTFPKKSESENRQIRTTLVQYKVCSPEWLVTTFLTPCSLRFKPPVLLRALREEGVIFIKETTKEAFEDFLGFLYEEKVDFAKKSLRKLFDILNLGERYQVQELKDRISQLIENFPLTTANVVEVAAIAEEFSHFECSSRALFSNCVTLIEKQFPSGHGVLKFVRENEDKITATKLLQRVKFVKRTRDVKNSEPVANNRTARPAWQHGNTIMQRILFFIFIDYFDIFICLFFSLTYALKGCIGDDSN